MYRQDEAPIMLLSNAPESHLQVRGGTAATRRDLVLSCPPQVVVGWDRSGGQREGLEIKLLGDTLPPEVTQAQPVLRSHTRLNGNMLRSGTNPNETLIDQKGSSQATKGDIGI